LVNHRHSPSLELSLILLQPNYLACLDDDDANNHAGVPGQQVGLDPDYQAKLDQLSKCRKLEDALPIAAGIISAASTEITACLQDVRVSKPLCDDAVYMTDSSL